MFNVACHNNFSNNKNNLKSYDFILDIMAQQTYYLRSFILVAHFKLNSFFFTFYITNRINIGIVEYIYCLKAAKQRSMLIKDNTEFEKLLVSIGELVAANSELNL
jgi:hypothetical protein